MAGTLTKIGIAGVVFAMMFTVFIYTMVELGNKYNVQMESTYSFSDYQTAASNVTDSYQLLSEGSSINQQASDTAQLQEGMSAEETKLGFWSVLQSAATDFFEIFPVHWSITAGISSIIIIIALSGAIYLWLGRVP